MLFCLIKLIRICTDWMSVYFHWFWHSYSQEPELWFTFLRVSERWITADTHKYPPVKVQFAFFFSLMIFLYSWVPKGSEHDSLSLLSFTTLLRSLSCPSHCWANNASLDVFVHLSCGAHPPPKALLVLELELGVCSRHLSPSYTSPAKHSSASVHV